MMMGAAKRQSTMQNGAAAKAQRVDGGGEGVEGDENAWNCMQCGNLNFGQRTVCNMRNCQTPKPLEAWICPQCGNENRENRPHCNKRTCGLIKPGLTMNQMNAIMATRSKPAAPAPMVTPMMAPIAAPAAGGAPAGSWQCIGCGNVNWPQRSTCNGKNGSCGLPRQAQPMMHAPMQPRAPMNSSSAPAGSWTCGSCGNVNWPNREVCNGQKGQCGMPRTYAKPQPAAGGQGAPAGSWVCTACNNLNFANRTVCNARNCGLPRAAVDGGSPFVCAPAAPAAKAQRGAPEGSWVCASCGNVNWPDRSSCNAKLCGRPRHEVDGGPAQAAANPSPAGSWVCSCGNVNWPQRTVCNKHGCGLPRG